MIAFNKTYKSSNEEKYILDVLARNKTCGDGYYTECVEKFIENKFGTLKALTTTSCSIALDMSALLIQLEVGDEVIMPSYTFVSTANAVALRGARPVFVDIDIATLNIDVNKIEEKITKKTKAIYVVHYAGISCDMDKLMNLARHYNLLVVEDAAQGVNAKYKEQFLGTIGDIGCYSFHETKNYSCGEGGALLINKSQELVARAEIIREKGTNRSQFFRGEVDKYTWVDIGSSYLPSEVLMAMLHSQFEEIDKINSRREQIYNLYKMLLSELISREKITVQTIPGYSQSNYHMFYILLKTEQERDRLLRKFKEAKINATFHYIPLHSSPMGRKFGYHDDKGLEVTTDVSNRLLRLPLHMYLANDDVAYIAQCLSKNL